MPGRVGRVAVLVVVLAVVCIVVIQVLPSGSTASRRSNDEGDSGLVQRLAVPAYIDPASDPGAWVQLSGSHAVGLVVANVSNGPGTQAVPAWSTAIHRAHLAGTTVLGYVDTGYLGRPNGDRSAGLVTRSGSTGFTAWIRQIEGDIEAWYEFYGSDIGGIFMDQTPSECGPTASSTLYAEQYRALTAFVRELRPGAVTALNPGTAVGQCFEDSADVLVTFEGTYGEYTDTGGSPNEAYRPLDWTAGGPGKTWHIIYGAGTVAEMRHALALSRVRGAGYVFVTDAGPPDPFDQLPPPPTGRPRRVRAREPPRSIRPPDRSVRPRQSAEASSSSPPSRSSSPRARARLRRESTPSFR